MAVTQKRVKLVNVADLLPEVIQGDPEVKVTRQRGLTLESRAMSDPFADLPVIQADTEVVVTRQKGVTYMDEGAGFVRMDVPADWDPSAPSNRVVSDQPVAHDAPPEQKAQTLASPHVSFHRPLQGGSEGVSRQGIKSAADAAEYLNPSKNRGVLKADESAKGVQVMTGAGSTLTPEQFKAYAAGKHFASDTPTPDAPQGKAISFLDQQMDPSKHPAAAGNAPKAPKAKKGAAKKAGRKKAKPRVTKVPKTSPSAVVSEKPPVGETPEEKTEREEKDA